MPEGWEEIKMSMLDEGTATQLKTIFSEMKNPVQVVLVTGTTNCETCDATRDFVRELAPLSEKIQLKEIADTSAQAKTLGVVMVPAIVLLDEAGTDYGIKYYGIPAGHEINSFIMGLLEVSGAGQQLPPAIESRIAAIDKPVDIKVFVTLGCPHCPGAVMKAHKLALMNPNVRAEMIEANTFGELSTKYQVSGVPKIVINETHELLGDQPLEAFLNEIGRL